MRLLMHLQSTKRVHAEITTCVQDWWMTEHQLKFGWRATEINWCSNKRKFLWRCCFKTTEFCKGAPRGILQPIFMIGRPFLARSIDCRTTEFIVGTSAEEYPAVKMTPQTPVLQMIHAVLIKRPCICIKQILFDCAMIMLIQVCLVWCYGL